MCELCLPPTFITDINSSERVYKLGVAVWKTKGEMATGSREVASSNTELGEDDLGALYEAIYQARNSYKSIGLLIGVKIGEIENIKQILVIGCWQYCQFVLRNLNLSLGMTLTVLSDQIVWTKVDYQIR